MPYSRLHAMTNEVDLARLGEAADECREAVGVMAAVYAGGFAAALKLMNAMLRKRTRVCRS